MGLGDYIEVITKYTGIKWLVEKVTKLLGYESCGCENRKQALNNLKINRNGTGR